MGLSIEPNAKYLLISFNDEIISDENVDDLKAYTSTSGEKDNYVIVDLLNVTSADKNKLSEVEALLQNMITDDGAIIFTSDNEQLNTDLASTFNDPDLLILPTVDEAIDYIFMDEIEKDVGGEG